MPDAIKAELSADDFAMYFGGMGRIAANTDYQFDQASAVFDRVRDKEIFNHG